MISVLLLAAAAFGADEVVYGDELAPNWYDWSWSGIPDFQSTDAFEGKYAAFTSLKPGGGFSIYRNSGFGDASALKFWIKGSGSIAIRFDAVNEGVSSGLIPLSPSISGQWTEHVVSLDTLTSNTWNRISFVDDSGFGGAVHVDQVELLDDDPRRAYYTTAEPMAPNHVVVYGAGDPTGISVLLESKPLTIVSVEQEGGPARTYVELEEPLTAGRLEVVTRDGTFIRGLRSASVELGKDSTHQISTDIYGANFSGWPPSPAEMDRYGYTLVRWGSDAQTTYNPGTRTMNLGEDGYFINQVAHPSLQAWFQSMDAELATIVTVPNLGWVADSSSYWQFAVATYGAQQRVAPTNNDAGNGVTLGGDPVSNNPNDAAVRFTASNAEDWLTALDTTPEFLAIGNELDIAHVTHRGLHPAVADYDERLSRYLDYAKAAKDAIPTADLLGPVSSGWFQYWNTDVPGHKLAAYNQDFLPWFLTEVEAADALAGRRTLDYLDVHYYPEPMLDNGWDRIQNATVNAWRLRATRSLWDPSYVDESWVGEDAAVTNQSNPHAVQLIPRLEGLIDQYYPGTKLAISEWSFGADWHLSGGLAAADALGIFGRYDVDMALISPAPQIGSYTGAAFELYRSGVLTYGRSNLPVTVQGIDPGLSSVYASRTSSGATTLVLVNKSPTEDLLFDVTGLPEQVSLRTKHFGGAAEARVVQSRSGEFRGSIAVPAYTAVLVSVETVPDQPTETDDGPCCDDTGTEPTDATDRTGRSCGCDGQGGRMGAIWMVAAALLLRRRQPRGA